jgi:hypothetical protein
VTETELICEVCHAEPAVGVACSVLGPVSVAYGRECLTRGYDPLGIVLATIYCVGPKREHYGPGYAEIIERSLTFHGLTWDEAVAGIDWTDPAD